MLPTAAVPFIDINANNNKVDVPVNVLGLQTHDISAANGNLSPSQASVPAAAKPPAPASESTNAKGINGNTVNVPVNVLGLQTHDISAANGNLSPGQASVPTAQSPAPAAAEAPAPASESTNTKGINGNTVNVPVNVLGAQTHDIAAFNGNGSPNRAQPPAAQAPTPAAQAVNAQGGLNNGSSVVPAAATPVATAAPNALAGAVGGMTSALYNLASAITGATGGKA
ncbi:hypothetical protein LLEC1_03403 [Akanthomyces lecanii]|uniref:Uncharacterized protein n=1 Tax=Cordyceps confragosa TaxID=2714763 RepID=A0A179IEQ8_CORDF|nr:hypothetical protein LLEC1_03403 [Akanthomyces lecanii]